MENQHNQYNERSDHKLTILKAQLRVDDLVFVGWAAAALLLLSSIPTLFGYLSTPPGKWFSGIVDNVHDHAQYLSWMRESQTAWFITNKLTSESNPPVFLNLHWWLAGKVALWLQLSVLDVLQVLRIPAIIGLVAITYFFCAWYFEDCRQRRFAFWLAVFSSGLGWIWVVVKQFTGTLAFPRDVHTTLGNAFYTMVSSPHLTWSAALTALTLLIGAYALYHSGWRAVLLGGLVALFLGTGHVYDLVTVWAVLAVFGLVVMLLQGWSWALVGRGTAIVLLSAPAPLYWAWVSSPGNSTWQRALAQYDNLGVFTPPPHHLLLLLGLALIPAVIGLVQTPPQQSPEYKWRNWFVRCWFATTFFLIYLPLPFQIMLLTGFHIPLALLATQGLYTKIIPWATRRIGGTDGVGDRRLQLLVAVCCLALVLPTNLYLFSWRILDLGRHTYPYFLDQDDLQAMSWLAQQTQPDDVVLSSFVIGHYLPGLTGQRTFLSNAVMTLDFMTKRDIVAEFFDPTISDAVRAELLWHYGITNIYFSPAEREIGAYQPTDSPLFELDYQQGAVQIFRVNPCVPAKSCLSQDEVSQADDRP